MNSSFEEQFCQSSLFVISVEHCAKGSREATVIFFKPGSPFIVPLCKDCLLHQPEKVDAFSQAAISWWLEWCKQLSSTTLCCFDQIPEKCLGINLERTKLKCWNVHLEPFFRKIAGSLLFLAQKEAIKKLWDFRVCPVQNRELIISFHYSFCKNFRAFISAKW